jgi:formylglycine-generating enzyme required for sulfatase activity
MLARTHMARACLAAALAVAGCDYARIALADADADAISDAPVDAATCTDGARRCEGNVVTECRSTLWATVESCDGYCGDGACIRPPSCGGGVATCGPAATDTCCRSLPVPGGTFSRSYDGVSSTFTDPRFRATVSGFHLDRYEVTTARFQAFVDAYPADQPQLGAGRNPHDAGDPGWLPEWTVQLPATRAALVSDLGCAGMAQVSSAAVGCVSWLVAQAFCIWDGGRLPTEAEWNYVAAGGDEQRVYPWSSPASSTAITSANAIYTSPTLTLDRPGTRSPAGDGRWGHADLAGNAWEWVFDYYVSPYATTTCVDCANYTVSQFRVNRGGSYANTAAEVITSIRGASSQTLPGKTIGFRCARNPAP